MYAGIYHYQTETEESYSAPFSVRETKITRMPQQNNVDGESTETADAADHIARIKRFAITHRDKVAVCLPMSDQNWLEVVDAALFAGANLVVADAETDANAFAELVEKENATVVATTSTMYTEVYQKLNAGDGSLTRMRTIVFDKDGNTEMRENLLLNALSKAKIDDVYAAYQKAPALKKFQQENY